MNDRKQILAGLDATPRQATPRHAKLIAEAHNQRFDPWRATLNGLNAQDGSRGAGAIGTPDSDRTVIALTPDTKASVA